MQNLPVLFLGLSYYEKGDYQKGIWLLESVLRREPYNQTALRTLAVYYSKHDRMKFNQYINKLIELDPQYQHWEIRDEEIIGQHFPINISYYDWTGIPGTRVRIGWHQASEKLILNDNTKLPSWLELLPITTSSSISEETVQSIINEGELFYRNSFFTSKSAVEKSFADDQQSTGKVPLTVSSELDEAFNFLEHIASRGFEPIDPNPEKINTISSNNESDKKETSSENDSEQLKQTPSAEERQMMREAWRCFSTDQQDLGVQLYKKLIDKPNCLPAVEEELEKLVILFPENTDLAELYNSIKG